MACVVAQAAAADMAMHAAANSATPRRNSISDCTGGPGDAVRAQRSEVTPPGASDSMQVHQQQLQQLISSQHAALLAQAGTEAAAPTVKVSDPSESDHPILVSFPSFSDGTAGGPSSYAAGDHASTHASTGVQHTVLQDSTQHAGSAGDGQHSPWPGSSSSCESPTRQGGSAGSSQHGRRKGGVSLLSQQIASSRSLAAAAAPAPGDAEWVEATGGASGRHRGEFWRFMQEQRAKEAAELKAAVGHGRHHSKRHHTQRQQQEQQQEQQQGQHVGQHQHVVAAAGRQVVVEIEEASPLDKRQHKSSKVNTKQQQQQQQLLQAQQQQQQAQRQQQQHSDWHSTTVGHLPQLSAAATPQPEVEQQQAQQQQLLQEQHQHDKPSAQQVLQQQQQQQQHAQGHDAQEANQLQQQQQHAQVPSLHLQQQQAGPAEADGSRLSPAMHQHQQQVPSKEQQRPQQEQRRTPRHKQKQHMRSPRPPPGPNGATAAGMTATQRLPVMRPSSPNGAVAGSPTMSSAVSGMLLDSTVADAEGQGGWVHQFISGCSAVLAHPTNSSSSWGGGCSLAAEAAAPPPPLQQQFGICDVSQPGWGLVTPAVLQGSVTAPKTLGGGSGRAGFKQPWGLGSGSNGGLQGRGSDSLGGFDDSEPLSEVLLAAAQMGTPPVPPKGSRFDDMDCFSSSTHKSASAIAAAAVAGELQARKAQQEQQVLHWKQQQKQRSLPHQLLLQLGLPAAASASGSSNAATESAIRRISMDSSPLGAYSRSQQQQQQPVSNLLLMLNGHLVDGSSSSSSSDPAAAAAAAAIMGQLEGLISGLSLLGERNATEVGHELAVAESIHDVCLQHRSRYSSSGNADPHRRSFGGRQQQQQYGRASGSSDGSVRGGLSHSGSNDSLRARLTAASLSSQRWQQQEGSSNGGGWQQRLRGALSSVLAGAGRLGSDAAAALKSLTATGSNGGSNAQRPLAAAQRQQQRSMSAGAAVGSTAAAAAGRGAVRRTRSYGNNVGQTSGKGGGLWQFPSSTSTAAAAAAGDGQLTRAATAGARDAAVQAAAAAVLAARANAGGGQQGAQRKRQGLGPNRRFR